MGEGWKDIAPIYLQLLPWRQWCIFHLIQVATFQLRVGPELEFGPHWDTEVVLRFPSARGLTCDRKSCWQNLSFNYIYTDAYSCRRIYLR